MKKRSFTLLMSALTISATLIGTSPVAAKTDTDTATEETTDKEETTAKDADSENTDNKETDASKSDTLEDGTYTAEFDTDSGMFHVNEANDGKGTLTVKEGKMTIHVSLASKKIVNLFVGKAEDAQKDGAEVLEPTTDTVTYSDGMSEEVYGFDIPVPAIDEEFDVALIGTKGKWYDHSSMIRIRRSIMCLPSLKLGMPKRSKPPGNSSFSNTVTSYPFRFNWFATVNPAGPLPITATFFPLRTGWIGCTYPSRKAASTIAASFSRIVTGSSQLSFSTQLFSQRAGQTRPVNSGKSSVCSNT